MPPTFAVDVLGSGGAYAFFLAAWLAFCCASWVLLRYPTLLHCRKPRKGAWAASMDACVWSARARYEVLVGSDHVHIGCMHPLIRPIRSNHRIPSPPANDPRFQAIHIAHRGCRLEGRQGGVSVDGPNVSDASVMCCAHRAMGMHNTQQASRRTRWRP